MSTYGATSLEAVDVAIGGAAAAAKGWAATPREERASALRLVADRLDAAVVGLVHTASEETHYPQARLRAELRRTTFQLRLFAELLDDGGYLDVRIDYADPDWRMGAARPELRRGLRPLGPVLNFTASNFPFAFGVAGGDTASALAAGCPVVVKGHSGHPRLSALTTAITQKALRDFGAPEGTFSTIFGTDAGRVAIVDERVAAATFTGSTKVGRALFDLAVARPVPIPFYGELGSVNPVFVTAHADAQYGEQIAAGFVESFTLGAGQFCTKPGLLVVPPNSRVLDELRSAVLPDVHPMLNPRIRASYDEGLAELSAHPAVSTVARGHGSPHLPAPAILETTGLDIVRSYDELFRECFGPAALVAVAREQDELLTIARTIEGQLTATVFACGDEPDIGALVDELAARAGRVLWNQWPTGVSVTYAQHHGGPFPATTAPSATSVGTASIGRFLRPVVYQGFPPDLLPTDLADSRIAGIPRQENGTLTGTN